MGQRLCKFGDDCWRVFDVHPRRPAVLDPALQNGWLCFERGVERRRHAPIPRDWSSLTDLELAQLWERARPVPLRP